MAEDIRVGSKLRVDLVFQDVLEDGTSEPIDLGAVAAESVKVWKPSGALLAPALSLDIDDAAAGEAHVQFTDELTDAGWWKVQGEADGYKSAVVKFYVERNP